MSLTYLKFRKIEIMRNPFTKEIFDKGIAFVTLVILLLIFIVVVNMLYLYLSRYSKEDKQVVL